MLLPPCGTTTLPEWHRVIPRAQEEVLSGQGVECKRSWLCVLQPNHTFPPLFHQSLQLKFHRQGWSEVRQEQTCFQEGEGEPNFLLEWAFSWSGLRKCHLPTCLEAEKSQAEIAEIISMVCFSSQKASKREWIDLGARSPAGEPAVLHQPFQTVTQGNHWSWFPIKLREPSLQGCRWDSSLAPGSKVEQWEKTSWRWKVVKAREPEWNPGGGVGLINVLDSK